MQIPIENLVLLCLGFFIIATLYASVGFGGGSSYLALLAIVVANFYGIRSIALICNLIVVSGSTYLYFKKGYGNLKGFAPFIITSIPFAFLGATFRLNEQIYFVILGTSLLLSAIFLVVQTLLSKGYRNTEVEYPSYISYLLGSGIGLLSGLVGIGGGIFLAPILLHLRWGNPRKIASLASFFILVNSISGLTGLAMSNTLLLPWPEIIFLVIAVFLGGQLGIRLSFKKLSPNGIKRVTALLVAIVGIRLLLANGLGVF